MNKNCAKNTDKELWREVVGDFYSPSLHVTQQGKIGINVGGDVRVMTLREWHSLYKENEKLEARYKIFTRQEHIKLRKENEKLKEFARDTIRDLCWDSNGDGMTIQDQAEELGLIVPHVATEEDVDPEYSDFSVGDTIYKFSDWLVEQEGSELDIDKVVDSCRQVERDLTKNDPLPRDDVIGSEQKGNKNNE